MSEIIKVRQCAGTYIARFRGKTASCTAGEKQAAEAVARKFHCEKPFILQRRGDDLGWDVIEVTSNDTDTDMERAVSESAIEKHGASGLCCRLRQQERRRADMWKALCLNARCVLSAHAVGFATQMAIGDAERSELPRSPGYPGGES